MRRVYAKNIRTHSGSKARSVFREYRKTNNNIVIKNISNIINISNGNERSEWGAEGAPHNTTHIAQFLKYLINIKCIDES